MDTEKRVIPKKAFDSEYKTEFLREVRFLADKGIKYAFVRKTPDYGISQYKYRKTPALFAALVEFYSMIEAERAVRKGGLVKEMPKSQNPEYLISPEQIKQAQELLEKAIQQGVVNGAEAPEKITVQDDTE